MILHKHLSLILYYRVHSIVRITHFEQDFGKVLKLSKYTQSMVEWCTFAARIEELRDKLQIKEVDNE